MSGSPTHHAPRTTHLVALATLIAAPAQAQLSIRAGGVTARYGGVTSGSAFSISPRFEMSDGPARGALELTYSRFSNGPWALQGGFETSSSAPVFGGAFGIIGAASGNTVEGGDWSGTGSASAVFGRPIGPIVAGIGAGVGFVRPISGGDARQLHTGTATIGIERPAVRLQLRGQRTWLPFGDYTDLTGSLAHRAGKLSLEGLAGARLFDATSDGVWQVGASYEISRRVLLEVSGGRWPASPEGFARGSYATAGVRLLSKPRPAAGAAVLTVTSLGERRVRVTIVLRGRRPVEIGGDWNEWTPVPMRDDGNGRWSIELPLGAGAHRFGIRRGEEWIVPDGVPSLPDDFGGKVGLIVVP